MELIIGGAYQGKLTYAASTYSIKPEEMLDLALPPENLVSIKDLSEIRCVYHLESLTYRAIKSGTCEAVLSFLNSLFESHPDIIVISREIGSGVVPMDKDDRFFREFHGKLLSKIAARADCVTRIFCGIGTKLKG